MLEIKVTDSGEVQIFSIAGRLDSTTSAHFEKAVIEGINAGQTHLIFDCSQLDYISSAGLRVILVTVKRLKPANGALVLCGLKNSLVEVFNMAGFTNLFEIVADQITALACFSDIDSSKVHSK